MNGKKKPSAEQVLASMRVGNPKPALVTPSSDSARAAASLEASESLIRLHIDSVITYQRNPRQTLNEKYVEIKESIRVRGKPNDIVKVTKRPGEDIYFPASGGNTRVMALKELYAETRDERFAYVDFIYTEYTGEADVLARHFIENDLRSDLVFWDKAKSLSDLKSEIEKETGTVIPSGRQFSEVLLGRGIHISRETLRTYSFALEKLADLGQATAHLSSKNVRDVIHPTYQRLVRLAEKFDISDEQFQERIARSVMVKASERYEITRDFKVDQLCADLIDATAGAIGRDGDQIRRMLAILDKLPNATRDELEKPDTASQNVGQPDFSNSLENSAVLDSVEGDSNVTSESVELATNIGGTSASETSAISSSAIGNSKSSDILFASGLTPGDNTRKQAENPTAALAFEEAGMPIQSEPNRPLQEATFASSDQTRDRFLADLRSFAQTANLADALRFDDALPLWFYVELPVTAEQGVPLDIESQAGGNPYRYLAWWFLANLAGIFDARMRNTLPNECDVAVALADDELWDDAVRNVVGEPLYQDTLGRLISWQADPTNPAGEALHRLLAALRGVRAAFPDRFTNAADQPREAA